MRYRIMVLLAMLIFVAGNCYALHFSSIVKLGNIGGFPTGGFDISGASYNSGTSYRNGKFDKEWKEKIYEKGVARFGTQNRGLWVYYDCSNGMYQNAYHPYFGDKDKTLTVRLGAGEGENVVISQITNNEGMSLFCLNGWGPAAGTSNYIVMGYRSDGSFVKYFDTMIKVSKHIILPNQSQFMV